jgi:chromosome segregation ATPase
MKKLLFFVLVLIVAIGALGYWRGWFSVTDDGKVGVHVDPAKFKKDQVAGLWQKTAELTGDEKAHAENELADLEKKHERLENQLKELTDAGEDRFETIKQDISKALADVDQKIAELTKRLEKRKGK